MNDGPAHLRWAGCDNVGDDQQCRRVGTGSAGSSFDPTKAGAFAGRLLGALNDGAFCPMASAKGLNSDADLLCDRASFPCDSLPAVGKRAKPREAIWNP